MSGLVVDHLVLPIRIGILANRGGAEPGKRHAAPRANWDQRGQGRADAEGVASRHDVEDIVWG